MVAEQLEGTGIGLRIDARPSPEDRELLYGERDALLRAVGDDHLVVIHVGASRPKPPGDPAPDLRVALRLTVLQGAAIRLRDDPRESLRQGDPRKQRRVRQASRELQYIGRAAGVSR
ncbi:MAG: hypothetical protein ACRENE_03405 [Polyangiaceae bacterium]